MTASRKRPKASPQPSDDGSFEDRQREAQARARSLVQEQSAELAALHDARPTHWSNIYGASLAGVLLFGLTTEDRDPISGVLRALHGDVAALAVLAGEQEKWGLMTAALEGIERRLDVALELRRREIEATRAK